MFDADAIEQELLSFAPPGMAGYFATALEGRIADALRAAVAAERERCAQICEKDAAHWLNGTNPGGLGRAYAREAKDLAAAIRAAAAPEGEDTNV